MGACVDRDMDSCIERESHVQRLENDCATKENELLGLIKKEEELKLQQKQLEEQLLGRLGVEAKTTNFRPECKQSAHEYISLNAQLMRGADGTPTSGSCYEFEDCNSNTNTMEVHTPMSAV